MQQFCLRFTWCPELLNCYSSAMILYNSSFVLPSLIWSRPNISSFLPSTNNRSLSVSTANFCFSLPLEVFQFPVTTVVFIFFVLTVNEFSLFKVAPTFFGEHYTIPHKSYIIHTFQNQCELAFDQSMEIHYKSHQGLFKLKRRGS